MQSALRVFDCFLLEGQKILFRVSLAILKVNEHRILSISDQVSVLSFLKEVARHTFDVDELFHVCYKVHIMQFILNQLCRCI